MKLKLGDKVVFNDPFSETLNGEIVDFKQPRCKCKGKGYYVVDFGGFTKEIKELDDRLSLHNTEPNKGSLGFNFI
jgi:hypothetical protein